MHRICFTACKEGGPRPSFGLEDSITDGVQPGEQPQCPGGDARRQRPSLWTLTQATLGAVVAGAMSVVFVLSFLGIIFSGPLAPEFSRAIGFVLIGAVVMSLVAAVAMPFRGTIIQPQDAPGVLLAGAAGAVAAGWAAGSDGLFATVIVMMATASLLTGAVLLAAGWLRLGHATRFMPYPVLCGFLAATGLRLVLAALGMATGLPLAASSLPDVVRPEILALWVPPLIGSCGLAWLTLRVRSGLALPAGIGLIVVGFYVVLAAAGRDLAWARQAGLLLDVGPEADFLGAVGPWVLAEADWWAIAGQTPALLAVAGLAMVSVVVFAPALEVAVQTRIDTNRELRATGLANLSGGLAGAMPGFHYFAVTMLARQLGVRGIWACVGVAGCSAAVLLFGAGFLGLMPLGLFAAVVGYVGLDLLRRWLWNVRHELAPREFAVTAAIVVVAIVIGLLEAIAFGLLAAVALFVVACAGLDVVRLRTTAAQLRSRVERSDAAQQCLAREGGRAAIFHLEGFLFFGTATRLRNELVARLDQADPRLDFVVLDVRRVTGIDASAARALTAVHEACGRVGAILLICGQSDPVAATLRRAGLGDGAAEPCRFASCDAAMRFVEDAILAQAQDLPATEVMFFDRLRRDHPDFRPERWLQVRQISRGTVLFEEGEPADCMVLIEAGTLRADHRLPDGRVIHVGTMLRGALVGEIGLYASVPRTARVIAETDATLLVLTGADLRRLEAEAPAVSASFHRLAAAYLARRLMLTSKLMRDAEL